MGTKNSQAFKNYNHLSNHKLKIKSDFLQLTSNPIKFKRKKNFDPVKSSLNPQNSNYSSLAKYTTSNDEGKPSKYHPYDDAQTSKYPLQWCLNFPCQQDNRSTIVLNITQWISNMTKTIDHNSIATGQCSNGWSTDFPIAFAPKNTSSKSKHSFFVNYPPLEFSPKLQSRQRKQL